MSKKVLDHFETGASVDWTSREAIINFRISTMRVLSGPGRSFDEQAARALVTREFDRAINITSSLTNHALMQSTRWRERLVRITAPTLVIHGTEDPVLPFGHGVALSKEIRGARLLPLEGAGHEIHQADRDRIIQAVVEHTSLQ
jgi:pimeloyl-ACP methyl ester carboxylesterase